MVTTSDMLIDISQQLLLAAATDAGTRVYVPGDWPTWDSSYPYIRIRLKNEHRASRGNGGINFDVTAVIRFTALVKQAAVTDDQGQAAEEAAMALKRQIEVAIINNPPLKSLLSEYPFTECEVDVSAEGTEHYAEVVLDIAMAFFQGAEAFYQAPSVPFNTFTAQQTGATPGPGVSVDLSSQE